jgi:hypothetical protein
LLCRRLIDFPNNGLVTCAQTWNGNHRSHFFYIYGPISPRKFRGHHLTSPGIGTHSYTVSSSWEECSAFSAADAMQTFVPLYRSTRYPLLLGAHRHFVGCKVFAQFDLYSYYFSRSLPGGATITVFTPVMPSVSIRGTTYWPLGNRSPNV